MSKSNTSLVSYTVFVMVSVMVVLLVGFFLGWKYSKIPEQSSLSTLNYFELYGNIQNEVIWGFPVSSENTSVR